MKRGLLLLGLIFLGKIYAADIYRGSSTAGSAAYKYAADEKRLYRGSSTAGSPFAVIENWDELGKPMLMFITILLGE